MYLIIVPGGFVRMTQDGEFRFTADYNRACRFDSRLIALIAAERYADFDYVPYEEVNVVNVLTLINDYTEKNSENLVDSSR